MEEEEGEEVERKRGRRWRGRGGEGMKRGVKMKRKWRLCPGMHEHSHVGDITREIKCSLPHEIIGGGKVMIIDPDHERD